MPDDASQYKVLHAPLSAGLVGVVFYFSLRWWKSKSLQGLRVPPGPPGRLLIGNLLDLPTTKEWLTFNQWAKDYGELVYNYSKREAIFIPIGLILSF